MNFSNAYRLQLSKSIFYSKGKDIYENGSMDVIFQNKVSAHGLVVDQLPLKVSIWLDPISNKVHSSCQCRTHSISCAHVIALILATTNLGTDEKEVLKDTTWQDFLKKLPKPKTTAVKTTPVAGKTWLFSFYLQCLDDQWQLSAARTYIRKDGKLGRRTLVRADYGDSLNDDISSDEEKALEYLKRWKAPKPYSSYYYSSAFENIKFQYGEDAGSVLTYLARSYVYREDSSAIPRRVKVINGVMDLSFQVEENSDEVEGDSEQVTDNDSSRNSSTWHIYPQLSINGREAERLDHHYRILTSSPLWLLKDDKLFRIESSLPADFFLPFLKKDYDLNIPPESLLEFIRHFLPVLKNEIQLHLPESVQIQTAEKLTGRRLYLKEENDNLYIELRLVYDDIEVKGISLEQENLEVDEENNKLWRIKRDTMAEVEIQEQLLDSGLAAEDDETYCITADEPLKWLFDELPKFTENGFEIFGEKNLKSHRVNHSMPTFNLAISSDIDWFDMNVEIDFGGVMLSLAALRSAVKKKESFVKLTDGSMGQIPEEWQNRFRQFFKFAQVKDGANTRVSSLHALLIDSLFDEAVEKKYDDGFKKRLKSLSSLGKVKEVPLPVNFHGTLRPYQQEGINWMGGLQKYSLNGCLADDMGLGKTVQALAHLLHQAGINGNGIRASKANGKRTKAISKKDQPCRTSLIVAPLSVIYNWEKETGSFTPDLKVMVHHGTGRATEVKEFKKFDIVLTTYALIRIDVELLKGFCFHYIILDESQNIKNPQSQTAKAATVLQSKHRLVLTGTPVENNTSELWSQFSFLNPGMLGSLNQFRDSFAIPIERHGDEAAAKLLKKMLSPFLLRRTKEQVVHDLPEKSLQIYFCAMSDGQKQLYERVRDKCRAEIMNLISENGMQDARFKVLQGLTRLRQISCHPALIEENTQAASGKFDSFLELLREILSEDHKVLVFSQFVRMLKIIAERLGKEDILFELLTGHTRNRQACVDRFQNDKNIKVFLISLKAGGLGLNLTAADYVMIFDPWWNPAAERQAIDRAHRIGQTKSVFAYKLITRGSVEEKILELQKRKEKLVSQLISTDSGLFKHLTTKDIENLFS